MDSRILHVGSQGPQVGYFTQGKPRNDFADRIREHAPWSEELYRIQDGKIGPLFVV